MKRFVSVFLAAMLLFSVAFAQTKTDALDDLASRYNSTGDSFSTSAEYIEDIDAFFFCVTSNNIEPIVWNACDDDVKEQYKDQITSIAVSTKDAINRVGYTETKVITTFALNDGTTIYVLIDSYDFTDYLF